MTPKLPTRVVLFDLDGTLTDSAAGIVAGFRHALETVGAPEPAPELVADVVGPPMADTFRRLGFDDETTNRAIAAYFESYDTGGGWANNAVFDGIEPILRALVSDGVRLGVATSKAQRLAVRILEHFDLAECFDYIGGASDDGTRRGKADVIAHTLRNLGIEPDADGTPDVVMVGDRDHDVHGAQRWGIPTIYAGWGYGQAGESDDAAWIAPTVADLAKLVQPKERQLHITFVCTGNICRSPMAEKIFEGHLAKAGLADRVRLSSAGTGSWHVGDPAQARTVAILRRHGYSTEHAAATVGDDHLGADLVIALDTGHDRALAQLGVPAERRRLLRSFDPEADGPDVPDPYYGDVSDYELVHRQIEAAVPGLLEWVRRELAATVD